MKSLWQILTRFFSLSQRWKLLGLFNSRLPRTSRKWRTITEVEFGNGRAIDIALNDRMLHFKT